VGDSLSTHYRAYSSLVVKAFDASGRTFSGIATTPSTDRVGDVVEPLGIEFRNPLPLFLFHDSKQPVGTVSFGRPTKDGVPFTANVPDVAEEGDVKRLTDKAAHFVKYGLIRAVSIGFRALEDGIEVLKSGGYRFLKTEVMELSLVPIPANPDAVINAHTIKSFDSIAHLDAEFAQSAAVSRPHSPALVGAPVVQLTTPKATTMKTYAERIAASEATRAAKAAELDAIQTKAMDEGRTKDAAESEQFDTLSAEIEAIDKDLADLHKLARLNAQKAAPVAAATPAQAAASREGVISVSVKQPDMPAGIGFARAVMCKTVARLDGRYAVDVAKERYPSDEKLVAHLKAAVPAGTSTQTVWAGPLVDQTNLAGEFIEYLRPMTVVGKFGQGGIPSLRRVPFNIRVASQTSGGTGYWVGEGASKPLTSFAFSATTLLYTKVAAIAVITQELARFSTPSAEALVRDALAGALIERLDRDFIDPAEAGTANVQPASITNGLTAQSSAGTSADNARTDLTGLISAFIEANIDPTSLVLIMPNTLALALSLMVNSLGQPEFPGLTMRGGTLQGIPVITSQYAANASGGGNLVIAVNASDVFLADDGQVTVDASTEASLQMADAPTANSATATAVSVVSMYQTNSIALRAERFINWAKRRSEAVVYMDDVNWGSVGSPS
jgi:HK97 family phage major capsid protein